jgi:transcriptional regulator with GAF, ATPase, and Fis domain/predicted negative regulator of RcsB-dependent stress response
VPESLSGRYELAEPLAEGKQGIVYRAHDSWDDRTVAIKILKEPPDPEGLRIWGSLHHPNIVNVLDVCLFSNVSYLSMEYIDGPSMSAAYKSHGEQALISLVIGLCRALHTAHSRGVCHGDIKPANLLVQTGATLQAKLTDFGLWRRAGVHTEGFSGTLAYAAPEVLRGDLPDHRSDLYALGATLYEILTGQPVFGGRDLRSIIDAHVTEKPTDPAERNPAISQNLSGLVLKLLEKEPTDRPSSAEEVVHLIQGETRYFAQPEEAAWVERPRVWSFLKRLETSAAGGHGSVVLLVGEHGIGKSTLLRKLELEAGIRGKPRLVFSAAPDTTSASTEELLRRLDTLALPAERRSYGSAAHRFIAAARSAAGDQYLLVLLDDIDAPDAGLSELLKSLIPLISTERILLIASLERRGLSSLQAGIPDLLALPHLRRVPLRAFTPSETGKFIASMLCMHDLDPQLLRLLYQTTGGNPSLVRVLVYRLISQGHLKRQAAGWIAADQLTIKDIEQPFGTTVDAKVSALTAGDHHLMGVIALFGRAVSNDILIDVLHSSEAELDAGLQSLLDQGLITASGGGWMLRKTLLTGLGVSSLTAPERAEYHRRFARAILDRWPESPSWLSLLAHHLAESGQRAEAFDRMVRGGDQALREKHYVRALELFQSAESCLESNDEDPTLRVLRGQAVCCLNLGKETQAAELFARIMAMPAVEGLSAPELSRIHLAYANALAAMGKEDAANAQLSVVLGNPSLSQPTRIEALAAAAIAAADLAKWDDAADHARSCLDHIGDDHEHAMRRQVENTLGVALLMQGKLNEARVHLEASYRMRDDAGEFLDAGRCALNLGILFRRLGQFATAENWLGRARERYEAGGSAAGMAQVDNIMGLVDLSMGNPQKATLALERSVRLALGCGKWRTAGMTLNSLGLALNMKGERKQALDRFNEAMVLAKRKKDRFLSQISAGNLGDVFLASGDFEQAEKWYLKAKALAEESASPVRIGLRLMSLARLYRLQNRLDHADVPMSEAVDILGQSDDERSLLYAHAELAELRLAQKRPDEARVAATVIADNADRFGAKERALALRVLAEIDAVTGTPDTVAAAFRLCLDHAEESGSLEDKARARLSAGRWLMQQGPVQGFRAAERYLSQAVEGFQRLGLPLLIEEAEGLLRQLASTTAAGMTLPTADSRKLASLYRMMTLLNSAKRSEAVLDQVLDLAVHAVRGERGLIILVQKHGSDFLVRAKTEMDGATIADARRISESVVKRVAGIGLPVFSSDALNDVRFTEYDSIRINRIACFVCVPLTVQGQIVGTIYVDSCNLSHRFSEDDVSYLVGFANQAAIAMENLRLREALEEENKQLQEQLKESYSFDTLVGHSPAMETVYHKMTAVAKSHVTVVIQGPTGTGKELVARAIHYSGPRAKRRFVPVNCSAFPESLLESELFGYVRGAFTGAIKSTEGLFLLADGGTIFLDEITDMSPNLQAKLLRVLETGEVKQLGQPTARRVDVRVVCATNKDLEREMLQGHFREDLYYRLKVVTIRVPSLAERKQDIPLLAVHFLNKYTQQFDKQVRRLSDDAIATLCSRQWPGNVRELEHAVEAAVALCPGKVIDSEALSMVLSSWRGGTERAPERMTLTEAKRSLERQYIARALQETGWNVSASARRLQVSRRQLQRLMRRYELGPGRQPVAGQP